MVRAAGYNEEGFVKIMGMQGEILPEDIALDADADVRHVRFIVASVSTDRILHVVFLLIFVRFIPIQSAAQRLQCV